MLWHWASMCRPSSKRRHHFYFFITIFQKWELNLSSGEARKRCSRAIDRVKGNVTFKLEEWGGGGSPSISTQGFTRETRVEWHLLSVETEANRDSKGEMKGDLLVWLVGLFIFVLPGLLELVHYKIFFSSPYTISIYFSSSPSKLVRQPGRVACLLMCVSDFYSHLFFYPSFSPSH